MIGGAIGGIIGGLIFPEGRGIDRGVGRIFKRQSLSLKMNSLLPSGVISSGAGAIGGLLFLVPLG
jgi:hypothetical protein